MATETGKDTWNIVGPCACTAECIMVHSLFELHQLRAQIFNATNRRLFVKRRFSMLSLPSFP